MVHIGPDQLIATLRSEGYRITDARRAVCEVIAEAHEEHLSAADVHRRASAHAGKRVDRATVYRTLEVLEDTGLLAHSHLGHGPAVYHLADEAGHQHLICRLCGRTLTLPEQESVRLVDGIRESTGFEPDMSHFAVSGRCGECVSRQ